MSFGGEPSKDGFVKHYELHYQPKKVEIGGGKKFQQFGCLNFRARGCQGGRARLTPFVKIKWSSGGTKAWFYYKVSAHVCLQGGKVVHVLRSHICGLDFQTEPPFECAELSGIEMPWKNTCLVVCICCPLPSASREWLMA
jgi:hypothetical protein